MLALAARIKRLMPHLAPDDFVKRSAAKLHAASRLAIAGRFSPLRRRSRLRQCQFVGVLTGEQSVTRPDSFLWYVPITPTLLSYIFCGERKSNDSTIRLKVASPTSAEAAVSSREWRVKNDKGHAGLLVLALFTVGKNAFQFSLNILMQIN
jgi:hypothetical protein